MHFVIDYPAALRRNGHNDNNKNETEQEFFHLNPELNG